MPLDVCPLAFAFTLAYFYFFCASSFVFSSFAFSYLLVIADEIPAHILMTRAFGSGHRSYYDLKVTYLEIATTNLPVNASISVPPIVPIFVNTHKERSFPGIIARDVVAPGCMPPCQITSGC